MYGLVLIYVVFGYNFDLRHPTRVQLHFLILARVHVAFNSRIRREKVVPSNFQ